MQSMKYYIEEIMNGLYAVKHDNGNHSITDYEGD